MKQIIAKISDGKVRLTGNGTFSLKDKIKKYGFTWKDGAWEGPEAKLDTVVSYVKNFKSGEIEIGLAK